jgi:hypothetical protein
LRRTSNFATVAALRGEVAGNRRDHSAGLSVVTRFAIEWMATYICPVSEER